MKKVFIGLTVTLMLGGCSLAPEYVQPQLELPETWGENIATQGLDIQWWKRFNDPVLESLIAETLANNKNLEIAMARVEQAHAYMGLSYGEQFPTLGAGASASSVQASRLGAQLIPSPIDRSGLQTWSTAFQAAWEVDLWGKYRNATAAAREKLFASVATQRGTLLSLTAQTCSAYFNLRNYDLQLSIAERTLKTREEALEIYQARFDEGLISELDLLRAKTEVDTVRTSIYTAKYQIGVAESTLLLLAGRSPRAIFEAFPERGLTLDALPAAPQLPAGLPSDLLTRRPDILAAEANLRAANFQVGVAKAAWFPSLSLTGNLGFQSNELDKLFLGTTGIWNYGASVTAPLLSFGRISNNVKVSEAAVREALASYALSVQTAFEEMRNALVIQANTALISETLQSTVKTLQRSVDLARLRYENGYSSYLEVLDAERSLFQSELQLAEVRATHLSAIVNVCLAMGGGWMDNGQPVSTSITEPKLPLIPLP